MIERINKIVKEAKEERRHPGTLENNLKKETGYISPSFCECTEENRKHNAIVLPIIEKAIEEYKKYLIETKPVKKITKPSPFAKKLAEAELYNESTDLNTLFCD